MLGSIVNNYINQVTQIKISNSLPLDSDGQIVLTILKRKRKRKRKRMREREREREQQWVSDTYPHLPMDNDGQNSL